VIPKTEAQVQGPVIRYGRSLGLRCDKLSAGSRFQGSGLPDYVVWAYGGRPVLVEFKRPGGELSALQAVVQTELKALKYKVVTIDNVEDGKRLMTELARREK